MNTTLLNNKHFGLSNVYNGRRLNFLLLLLVFVTVPALAQQKIKLVILHTNDTHSQVEPTEKSMGGYSKRMGVIKKIREQEKNVLLLDAGDFSQGTPYFNFYNGRVEIDAMNRMEYDAATLGNHEFDNGADTLAVILKMAKFPFLSSNYKVENTALDGLLKPYLILEKGGLRIGILALDVQPKGLIIESNYKGIGYEDPLKVAQQISAFLRKDKKCDLVICLSHLGAHDSPVVVNDYEIARNTSYIDVIIGGHSHTLLENVTEKNVLGKPVVIAQMGKSGLYLGKVELEIEKK